MKYLTSKCSVRRPVARWLSRDDTKQEPSFPNQIITMDNCRR